MTAQSCVFCKIIAKQIPVTHVEETDNLLVIKDRAPKAPIHYLIIPKKHIENVGALVDQDVDSVAQIFLMARDLAKKLSGSQAFRLVVNNGADAGQSVFHLHVHFLSGKKMFDL